MILEAPPVWDQILIAAGGKACVVNGVATLDCIPVVIKLIIQSLLLFAGIVAVFVIIQSGAKFVLSSGDPKKLKKQGILLYMSSWGLLLSRLHIYL